MRIHLDLRLLECRSIVFQNRQSVAVQHPEVLAPHLQVLTGSHSFQLRLAEVRECMQMLESQLMSLTDEQARSAQSCHCLSGTSNCCNIVRGNHAFTLNANMVLLQLAVGETETWPRDCQLEGMGGRHEAASDAELQIAQIEAHRAGKVHQQHQGQGPAVQQLQTAYCLWDSSVFIISCEA